MNGTFEFSTRVEIKLFPRLGIIKSTYSVNFINSIVSALSFDSINCIEYSLILFFTSASLKLSNIATLESTQ